MAQLACKQVLLVDLQAVWGTIEWIYVFFLELTKQLLSSSRSGMHFEILGDFWYVNLSLAVAPNLTCPKSTKLDLSSQEEELPS